MYSLKWINFYLLICVKIYSMTILIKNILLNSRQTDVLINENVIADIDFNINVEADKTINGDGKALIPGLFNGHNHAAMTLLRGYGDDMPLMPWLEKVIWPTERYINEEDVYWGAQLACLEMIKSGTTTFVDMYHFFPGTARAVDEMGMRGMITQAGFDFFKPELAKRYKADVERQFSEIHRYSNRIRYAIGAHAIYTVSGDTFKWLSDFSKTNDVPIHTHLSETIGERENSIRDFGKTPVQYLDKLGILNDQLSLAHCVHLDDTDIKLLADNGVQVVHNPASNMKLASGNKFRYSAFKDAGITVAIGTDGPSSSNNLDMFTAMKLASFNGKAAFGDPELWNAEETFKCVTESVEAITGFNAGKIEKGYLADLVLVDLQKPEMVPNHNLISNLVYSANGSIVDTVICDGKILMENRKVEREDEILKNAQRIAENLVNRKK